MFYFILVWYRLGLKTTVDDLTCGLGLESRGRRLDMRTGPGDKG